MERWQSTWEHRVRFNLSESGVHPLSIADLLEWSDTDARALLNTRLGYGQSNGSDELRALIAGLYPGTSPDQVLVTAGSSEANFVTCWRLIEPGDGVAMMLPAYWQALGLVQNLGAKVRTFFLRADAGWEPDADDIRRAIAPRTKLVVVTNPNNPTGHILSDGARQAITDRAEEVGAWILADEVYRGAERDGRTTRSFWGGYDRLVVVGGLSKAYGLPGLRVGWAVSTPAFAADVWARRDYTTICPTTASDHLATLALSPRTRERILERTRRILNDNYPVLDRWLAEFGRTFEWTAPQAGAISWARYHGAVAAVELVERLRVEHSVLLVPGEHFGMPGYLRFGYGDESDALAAALAETRRGLRHILGD